MIYIQNKHIITFLKSWKFIFSLGLLFSFGGVQQLKAETNEHYRLYYFQTRSLNDRWTLENAGGVHYRPQSDWLRFEQRTTGFFKLNRDVKLAFGERSNFVITDGSFSQYEFRPFQAVIVAWPRLDYIKFDHRGMIEERFFFNANDTENLIQARLRYRLDTKIPLNNVALVDNTYYFRPMVETFMSFGENIDHLYLSQMKYTAAAGYRFSKKATMEFRYEFLTGWSDSNSSPNLTNLFRLQFNHNISKK